MLAQGRILEAVAEGEVLSGTLDRLGKRFELPPDELRACLRELVHVGWIAVQTLPFGRLTVRLERRSPGTESDQVPTAERRRGPTDAWRL